MQPEATRRTLLKSLAPLGATLLCAPALIRSSFGQGVAGPKDDPFKLGVAAGAPVPDGFVLWTRLAPDPLSADLSTPGGMHGASVEVGGASAVPGDKTSLPSSGIHAPSTPESVRPEGADFGQARKSTIYFIPC